MIKKIAKLLILTLIILISVIVYLSYFGIETKQFNQIIKDKIIENNNEVDIDLNKVKIILNLDNLSIGLKTQDSTIFFKDKKISLDEIQTNFSIGSFL